MAARAASQAEERLRITDREQALRRTIRALPQPMLSALRRGLERHGDELIAGRLFKSRTDGGCAVGVMLLELDPELRSRGRLRFWLRDRWRRGTQSYRGTLSRNPRLKHLEWIFDSLVEDLGVATAGRSIRLEAERELELRRLAAAPSLPHDRRPVPTRP